MAVTSTPLTLELNQDISALTGKTSIPCYNDSGLTDQHFKDIPNDGNPQWFLKWANVKSVAIGTKGEYAVAVQVYESLFDPIRTPLFGAHINWFGLLDVASKTGEIISPPDLGRMYIMPGSIKEEGDYAVFKKIVWVRNSDLVLQSAAETEADRLKEEKDQQEKLDKALKDGGNVPKLGNNDTTSSSIWIVLGVIILVLGGVIWALIAWLKRRKKKAEMETGTNPNQNIQIIKIPKSS